MRALRAREECAIHSCIPTWVVKTQCKSGKTALPSPLYSDCTIPLTNVKDAATDGKTSVRCTPAGKKHLAAWRMPRGVGLRWFEWIAGLARNDSLDFAVC